MAFASLAFLSITPCKVIRIPSAYGIWNPLPFKIWNSAQGIRNHADDWIPELEFHRQGIQNAVLISGIHSVKSINPILS